MRKTISKLLCMVTVLAVVLSMMTAVTVSAAYTERLPRVTVHLLGDSTVASYAKNPNTGITGWGQALEALLNEYVTVNNWAISGLSTKGMLQNLGQKNAGAYEEQWTGILGNIDAGDYVFIQFGHNDQASGEAWSSSIEEYKENLIKMVNESKAKGAIPVLVTPPERMYYATQGDTLGGYPAAMIEAAGNDTLLIDLNNYSKEVLSTKTQGELEAFYAKKYDSATSSYVSDTSHFSPSGALTLATYIAEQAPFLKDYIKTGVTAENIDYSEVFYKSFFQNAVNNADGTRITNTHYTRPFNTDGTAGNYKTSVYTEGTNKAYKWESLKNGTGQDYFALDNLNGAGFISYDSMIKVPANKSAKIEVRDKNWQRAIYIELRANNTSVNMSVVSSNYDADKAAYVDRTLTFGNVLSMKADEWNKFRLIVDQENKKYHIIVNEKLVCTDVPYRAPGMNSSENALYAFYFGVPYTDAGNTFYLDDVVIKSVSERQTIKMLLEGIDACLTEKTYYSKADSRDGWIEEGTLYFPAHATTAQNSSISWGEYEQSRTACYKSFFYNQKEDADFSTSTTPYRQTYNVYSPMGYDSFNDAKLNFNPTIKAGNTSLTLKTADMVIKRRLLLESDADLEISVPRVLNHTTAVAPNGTALPFSSIYSNIDKWINTVMRIKNTGTGARKVLLGIAFYQNDQLLSISNLKTAEITAGGEYEYKVTAGQNTTDSAIMVNGKNKGDIPENANLKFFVLDADTLKPIIDVITIK